MLSLKYLKYPDPVELALLDLLTIHKGSEEHSEPAQSAAFICPHPHHPCPCLQRDIVGYRAAELGLQVFNGTAPIIHSNKVPFAFVGMLHLIVQKSHIDLLEKRNQCL